MVDSELQKIHGEKFTEFEMYMSGRYKEKGSLLNILLKAQMIFGYISKSIVTYISRILVIPEAEIFGSITFYPKFIVEE